MSELPTNLPAPPPPPEWATYVPGRSTKSQFVMHNTLGHAKNAITSRGHQYGYKTPHVGHRSHSLIGVIYHWDGTTWQVEDVIYTDTDLAQTKHWAESSRKQHQAFHKRMQKEHRMIAPHSGRPCYYCNKTLDELSQDGIQVSATREGDGSR